ncbi:MAG: coenzyme F420-0:L-glutamate ligase [Candidatus Peregrinibacteria bacterium]|nr:coenzyme F420-0:L-glutamate ligase [Candidatus Peregrinibacteria bacterium]MDZ4244327.1 coenzyme F420-0:L-glutamate ligase [Candidatus Gracilibacteria bacterium]
MELVAVKTAVVKGNGDIVEFVVKSLKDAEKSFGKYAPSETLIGSVIVISAKIVSILEGNLVNLDDISFKDLVQNESDEVIREVKCGQSDDDKCFLTRKNGILIPNAGADRSNVPNGYAIPWPRNPQDSAEKVRQALLKEFNIESLGIIIADSRITPGRKGTTGLALAWSGFIGVRDERGTEDLFGVPLQMTELAVADNLTTAAMCIMGESAECTPIVIIKEAPVTFTDASSNPNEAVINSDKDLFAI